HPSSAPPSPKEIVATTTSAPTWSGASLTTQLGTKERPEPTGPRNGHRAVTARTTATTPTPRQAQPTPASSRNSGGSAPAEMHRPGRTCGRARPGRSDCHFGTFGPRVYQRPKRRCLHGEDGELHAKGQRQHAWGRGESRRDRQVRPLGLDPDLPVEPD